MEDLRPGSRRHCSPISSGDDLNQRATTTVLSSAIALLVLGGTVSFLTGIGPGLGLLVVALILGISQRTSLARAIRIPDNRLRRLTTAAVLARVFVASYLLYLATIGDTWTGRETLLAVGGTLSLIGSLMYLVMGLLTLGLGE